MSRQCKFLSQFVLFLLFVGTASWNVTHAQVFPPNNNNSNNNVVRNVGGIKVDTDGVLKNIDPKERKDLAVLLNKALQKVPAELNDKAEMRMVSLRMLQEKVAEHLNKNEQVPLEIQLLAGLQRVQYVFVDEANKDIIIAGPAEGWKLDDKGTFVGVKSGRPVLLLDDLCVALRSIDSARNGGISCSIDPTEQGMANYKQIVSSIPPGTTADALGAAYEKGIGMQTISVTGVPGDSHFAQVMVAADYRMKRLGMKLDASPVKNFPSYIDLAGAGESMSPRVWLAPSYAALGKDATGLAWEIKGSAVKCESADDQIGADGKVVASNTTVKNSATKWAEMMTQKYDELAASEPVFAQLQGCMDMAVVAALLKQEQLAKRAGLEFNILTDAKTYPHVSFNVPKQVPTIASKTRKSGKSVVTASGGVLFQPWALVGKSETHEKIAAVKTKSVANRKSNWWWN